MKRNPVYSREMRVSSRSIRLPVILAVFNGILSFAVLLNMYSAVEQVKAAAAIQYSRFMDMYELAATLEFVLVVFLSPAVTASSISGERERQTLDLMLSTQMTAAQVVVGKLLSALTVQLLLIVSGIPLVAMVFVYGGITLADAAELLLCYTAAAFFAGSLGICCSSLFKRSTISTVAAYWIMTAVVAGTYFINQFALSLSSMSIQNAGALYMAGQEMAVPSSGGAFYLFLLNPAVTFLGLMDGQAGRNTPMFAICSRFGMEADGFIMEHWIPISILIQLALGVLFLLAAVRWVEPIRRKKKGRRRSAPNMNLGIK